MFIEENRGLLYRFQKMLGSTSTAVFFLLLGSAFFVLDWSPASVAVFSVAFISTLFFCKDVKNIFAYLFYVAYCIVGISTNDSVWGIYIPCIACDAVAVITFTICKLATQKVKRGRMFYPWIAFAVATLIGGLGRFNPVLTLVLAGAVTLCLFFYLIAINFTEDLTKFLAIIFTVGALLISLSMTWYFIYNGANPLDGRYHYIFAENINTAAVFIMLGIVGCFYLGFGKKYDYIYALLCLVLFVFVILTQARMTLLISAIVIAVEFVLFFKYSDNRRVYLILLAALILAGLAGFVIFREKAIEIINKLIERFKSGLSGRDELWAWCFEKFRQYPYFGYGLVSDEVVPTMVTFYGNLVMAHNTFIHWLTTTGVVGTAIVVYFYFGKYKVLFNGFNKSKIFHALVILAIEVGGILDQSPVTDLFVLFITFVVIGASETQGKIKLADREYVLSNAPF